MRVCLHQQTQTTKHSLRDHSVAFGVTEKEIIGSSRPITDILTPRKGGRRYGSRSSRGNRSLSRSSSGRADVDTMEQPLKWQRFTGATLGAVKDRKRERGRPRVGS